MRSARLPASILAAGAAALLVLPGSALGHAVLKDSSPQRGAELASAPATVEFGFNEPVEASFGAIRLFDRDGNELETGPARHPGTGGDGIGADLPASLADGVYTATYRVVSADGHPVSGGVVFFVGESASAPRRTVAELIGDSDSGPVSSAGFALVRLIAYASLAILVGCLTFAALPWRHGARSSGLPAEQLERAGVRLTGRLHLLAAGAAIGGTVAAACGFVFQGAVGAGTSFFSALDPGLLADVAGTHSGRWWLVRAAAFALLAGILAGSAGRRRLASLTGTDAEAGAPAMLLAGVGAGLLVAAPVLGGHAATQSPEIVLIPAALVHVAAFAIWAGGLVALIAALPAATRALEPEPRAKLLLAVLNAFSAVALVSVAAILATGVIQSIVHLTALADLTGTGFGRALLVKIVALAALIAIGATHRRRLVPALRDAVEQAREPGDAGHALRRAIRAEVALTVVAIAAVSALVSHAPPTALRDQPVSGSAEVGPALLEYTVDPARPGSNEIHLYLFDSRSGAPLVGVKELRAEATQLENEIGPLRLESELTGPGHYTVPGAQLGVVGRWRLDLRMRLGKFEEARAAVEVPIR